MSDIYIYLFFFHKDKPNVGDILLYVDPTFDGSEIPNSHLECIKPGK